MYILLMSTTLIFFITVIVMLLASILSKKIYFDREKNSSFECGFDPKSSFRMPFSLQFFLVAIIFLIFDVEITLFFPLIMSLKFSSMNYLLNLVFILISILLLGLYHEWNQGALDWYF